MRQLRHRDLDHRDLVHHSVHDPVFLQRHQLHQRHQRQDHLNGMDHLNLVHLFRCVVEIVNLVRRHYQQDVVMKDVLQILDEQNLDEGLTFPDVVRHFLVSLVDVQVGAELRHQLKMGYYQDVVVAELRHLLYPKKMDYYQDELQASEFPQLVLQVLQVLQVWQPHSHLESVVLALLLRRQREMP